MEEAVGSLFFNISYGGLKIVIPAFIADRYVGQMLQTRNLHVHDGIADSFLLCTAVGHWFKASGGMK